MAQRGGIAGSIEFFWAPDFEPEKVAQDLIHMAQEYEHVEIPLTIAAAISQEDMRQKFATETGASGDRWHEWAKSYAPVALATGEGRILQRFGHFRDAATSLSAFRVAGNDLFYDMSNFPVTEHGGHNLGTLHELGTDEGVKTVPAGTTVGTFTLEKDVRLTVGVGRGKALPAREFIELTAEAQEKIIVEFQRWFDGIILKPATTREGVPIKGVARGAGGQFVSLANP